MESLDNAKFNVVSPQGTWVEVKYSENGLKDEPFCTIFTSLRKNRHGVFIDFTPKDKAEILVKALSLKTELGKLNPKATKKEIIEIIKKYQ